MPRPGHQSQGGHRHSATVLIAKHPVERAPHWIQDPKQSVARRPPPVARPLPVRLSSGDW
ncbi:hypothetical protein VD0002_g10229 [Verticillium dahliae]|nr:hypothetical protein VD0004_g9806 [Verticillium dahliae]PNH51624.1 hypothetical protein VD0002_g10229 [Verticillium dahliae]PNH60909.1 hypothetical protein VD0001_g9792 [Verticillium dahliae]